MSDASPMWLCMVASEAVSDELIAYTHVVDEVIMHRHTTIECNQVQPNITNAEQKARNSI